MHCVPIQVLCADLYDTPLSARRATVMSTSEPRSPESSVAIERVRWHNSTCIIDKCKVDVTIHDVVVRRTRTQRQNDVLQPRQSGNASLCSSGSPFISDQVPNCSELTVTSAHLGSLHPFSRQRRHAHAHPPGTLKGPAFSPTRGLVSSMRFFTPVSHCVIYPFWCLVMQFPSRRNSNCPLLL